ncbi:FecR family protein [Pollutibacter soli]|uniref:FecR family protein n=1 Tax=Pollutibacter soli TaxID=3034157 RepID=UPI0030134C63
MTPYEISDFLEKYAAGMHSPAEHQEFINWLKTASADEVKFYAEEYEAIILSKNITPEEVDASVVMQIERALDQFELAQTESTRQNQLRLIIWRKVYRSAAAIILLVASGYFLYTIFSEKNGEKDKPAVSKSLAAEILPGGNKATLTLGNGATISLDDAKNGAVAQQGNVQVYKTAGGELVYKSSGEIADVTQYNTLSTPRGGQYKLTLPDGSQVWLNSSSSIRYPTVFTDEERHVNITGEAYFEIAHDPLKPFIVQVNDLNIKVLGTHFNVNAYTDESSVNTTLLQGSVQLSNGNHSQVLKPGQQAQAAGPEDFKLVDDVDVDEVVAWKNGFFSFNKADLQTVMRQIERWYDVSIEYEGKIPKREFVGKISRNSNVKEVLKILQESKVHFRVEGRKIIVTP